MLVRSIVNSAGVALLFTLSAFLWKICYTHSDWALLVPLPLAILLFIANYRIALRTRRAWLGVVLRHDSWIYRLLSGRIYATATSLLFMVLTMGIILWKSASLPFQSLGYIALLFFLAALLSGIYRKLLGAHAADPFDRRIAIWLTVGTAGLLFFFLFWHIAHNVEVHDGTLRGADFFGALEIGLARLPHRQGLVVEILALPYAYEAFRIWAAVQLAQHDWLSWTRWLFSLDMALFSFFLARAAAILADLLDSYLPALNLDGSMENIATPGYRTMSHGFWGTILLLLGATLVMLGLGHLQNRKEQPEAASDSAGMPVETAEEARPRTTLESFIARLRGPLGEALEEAPKQALLRTAAAIDPLVDKAYAPVYDAIPKYTDFHYSVLGEYIELGALAVGKSGKHIEEMLYQGLGKRLDDVSRQLDADFARHYADELKKHVDALPIEESEFNQTAHALLDTALSDASGRMKLTAPVAAVSGIASALAIKAASKAMGKKLIAMTAAKATAKGGAKLAAPLAGAGVGLAICAPGGPLAAICGAAAGAATWIGVDKAVIKIDEHFNREEFEANLRKIIDEDKQRRKELIVGALNERASRMIEIKEPVLANFTLQSLGQHQQRQICTQVNQISQRYTEINQSYTARHSSQIAAMRQEMDALKDNDMLGSLAGEVSRNLRQYGQKATINHVVLSGNFPEKWKANRKIRGTLQLAGKKLLIQNIPATKADGFRMRFQTKAEVDSTRPPTPTIEIEQQLRLLANRLYSGSFATDKMQTSATGPRATIILPGTIRRISSKEAASPASAISLKITLTSKPLPKLQHLPACK